MPNKFMKLDKPCGENWNDMEPNQNGRFCHLCAKDVVDFTNLSPIEISKKMKEARGNICARVSEEQLKAPLIDLDYKESFRLPYFNIMAGLMMATALTLGTSSQATVPTKIQTELAPINNGGVKAEKNLSAIIKESNTDSEFIIFKGKIQNEQNGEPVKNAKVMFISLGIVMATYTAEDGSFSLVLPANEVDDDNVIQVNYKGVEIEQTEEDINSGYGGLKSRYYLLTKEEISSEYLIKAEREVLVLGGLRYSKKKEKKPVVFYKGQKMKFEKFLKILKDPTERKNYENRYLHLGQDVGKALYANTPKTGLYVIYDEPIP